MSPDKGKLITEEEKLKIRLARSHTERFRVLMRLIKLSRKLKQAKIIEAKP
jgi:hypothetical protein